MDWKNLTKTQRAGQRLMVGFDGTRLDDTLKFNIEKLGVGGLILFARNLSSPQQMERLCQSAQAYASECGHPPLFISIDQEGGVVSRLKPPFTQFEGQPQIRSNKEASHFAKITASELTQIGVNMNMSPVLDVLPQQGPSVMQDRAFGSDPDHVAVMGTAIIDGFQNKNIMAVAKHFPGIGRTVLDSHLELPDLATDAQLLYDSDIKPFQHAIDTAVAGIMISHIRYHSLDTRWPASLSPAIVGDLLRDRLGYRGMTITDDLDMGAIAKHHSPMVVVEQCVAATIDILLICHAGEKIETMHRHLIRLEEQDDQVSKEALRSLNRIMDLKTRYLAV